MLTEPDNSLFELHFGRDTDVPAVLLLDRAWMLIILPASEDAPLASAPLRYPPMNVKLLWAAPLFISLGAAAFGWREGWALPGLAGLAYALFARFLPTPERPAQ
jgi:hypothetical protein